MTRYDSVPLMVDALFDAPSHREFSKAELAKKAGISPKSVRDRLSILHQLGVVEYVGDTGRVTLDLENELTWKLREVDGLLKEAQAPDGETDGVESVDHAEPMVDK